jgi:hypothetical protein
LDGASLGREFFSLRASGVVQNGSHQHDVKESIMKTRIGFISNSSSSSFIVIFDKKPRSAKELQKAMFGDKETVAAWRDPVPTKMAAESIFKSLRKQKPLPIRKAIMLLETGVVERGGKSIYPHDAESAEEMQRVMAELANLAKGRLVFEFKYSDNDGNFGSTMEHGDIFRNFDHFIVSHH